MKKIFLLTLITGIFFLQIKAQVYKKPGGQAETIPIDASYKKINISAGLKSFYAKIDSLQKPLMLTDLKDSKNVNILYYKGFTYLYLQRFNGVDQYGIDDGSIIENQSFNVFTGDFAAGNSKNFLNGVNKSLQQFAQLNGNMELEAMLYTNYSFECIFNKAVQKIPDTDRLDKLVALMEKNEEKKPLMNVQKDLAIIYAIGYDLTNGHQAGMNDFGKIPVDYQKSLFYLEKLAKVKNTSVFNDVFDYLYQTIKAYDLLQMGIANKDADKVKQAADIYVELWQYSADKTKWDNLFKQVFTHVTNYVNLDAAAFGAPGARDGGNDEIERFKDKNNPKQFDPYFTSAIRLQLATLIISSCYQVQLLSPAYTLNNGTKPADYATEVYKSFILNF